MPKISAILPCYKVGNYLRQCLETIEYQTFTDFECLIIDDCGNDNSLAIAMEFSLKDERFKVLRHTENKGIATSRNTGFDNAKGDIIMYIDPDDWCQSNSFEKVINAFDTYPEIDSVWFNYFKHFENQTEIVKSYALSSEISSNNIIEITPQYIKKCCTCLWNKAFKKSSIEEIKLRFPDGQWFEDEEYHYKFYINYPRVYYMNEFLYNYRIRENSFMRKGVVGKIDNNDMFKMFMNIYNYTIELGKFEQYKPALLCELSRMIGNQRHKEIHQTIVDGVYEILEKINFPSDFKEFEEKEITVSSQYD